MRTNLLSSSFSKSSAGSAVGFIADDQIEGGQAKEGLGAADDIIARKLLVERSGGRTGGRGKGIAAGFMVGISNR